MHVWGKRGVHAAYANKALRLLDKVLGLYNTLVYVPKEKAVFPNFQSSSVAPGREGHVARPACRRRRGQPQSIGALERGDHSPSLDLAFSICEVFDLPVEAVFSRTEFQPLSTEIYRKD